MNNGLPLGANTCDFGHTDSPYDLHYIAENPYQNLEMISNRSPPSQQLTPVEYQHLNHEMYLPSASSQLNPYDFAQSSINHPGALSDSGYLFPQPNFSPSPEYGDVNHNAQSWEAQSFIGYGGIIGHTSSNMMHDINRGYSRLQDRRPGDSFYQPDARLTVGPELTIGPPQREQPKKQTLACLFCRERKIACGRLAPGSLDMTCNQCARRDLLCTYPTESRRGQHKRKSQRGREPRLLF
ncbi:hypothetical protein DFJ43DRAFT_538690 [Lentinula guzmanii]|uniref:Zn(2)-C6 fungal-type domain-containing protein n=3 Tax=Lentinula TaxID=5352 RepID=A0AA38MXW9_9AGAR|nr:hypothetical protein DFJ43DRAFT_538690 [Lentinula guzmanii]